MADDDRDQNRGRLSRLVPVRGTPYFKNRKPPAPSASRQPDVNTQARRDSILQARNRYSKGPR